MVCGCGLSVERAGALSQIPWEFLRDPVNDFLALSRRTPIVRYTQQLNTRPPAAITMPLRVLVMISAPEDYPTLDVEGEWQRLQEATAPLQARGLLQLERLDTATLIALQRRLRAADYHIFHYIGHSDYDADTQQGVLIFESERDSKQGQIISGTALSRELAEESTVRLVVMNSCHSADRPPADALSGIASSIVTRGIPAVAAMQYAITDAAAKAFAEEFYRAISELLPIDAAMSEARRAISNRVQNNEWATPVLYMRADDGELFRPTAPKKTSTATMRAARPRQRSLIYAGIIAGVALLILVFGLMRFLPPPVTPPTLTPTTGKLPDLQIGRVRVSPSSPAPGQIFILGITITNAGNADSGPFNWDWDASIGNPVLLNSLDGHIDNIPAGASKNISFPFSYGWWGAYNAQLKVDVDSQVTESDERNNNLPFEIDVAPLPFVVDFSLLPSNQLSEPPMTLSSDEFAEWNLDFAVNAEGHPNCSDTPMELIDLSGDTVMIPNSPTADCNTLPLSIRILRGPVGTAVAEIVPTTAGNATITYYADTAGQQMIFQSDPVALTAGQHIQLSANASTTRRIRRIDISAGGQAVRLTKLTLTPVAQ